MSHFLIRVQGHYAVWSTVVDAPLTPFVAIVDDPRAMAPPFEDLSSARLARLEQYGSSLPYAESGEEIVTFNRAGPDESCLSIAELLHMYANDYTVGHRGEDDDSTHEGR